MSFTMTRSVIKYINCWVNKRLAAMIERRNQLRKDELHNDHQFIIINRWVNKRLAAHEESRNQLMKDELTNDQISLSILIHWVNKRLAAHDRKKKSVDEG
ncbi:Hypothetical predicted protein [Mytilus galloprovincialis]|uniref:Uncharacterized protein n=1 Tax=Mytilus galloprovincialis TaxID=29158 RepID=A0A8B6EPG0_MYTGA|nr:Hypothetical predicted protein [Mytilus galloprovincialis]